MSDPFVIRGNAKIELRDQLRFLLGRFRRGPTIPILVLIEIFAFRGLIQTYFADIWSGGAPAAMRVGAILGLVILFALFLFLILITVVPLCAALSIWQTGHDRRMISYEIDVAGVRTRDALGAELNLPWRNVRRARFTRHLVFLRLKPRGWRYVILRAFSPEDRSALRQLTTQMTECIS